MTSSLCPVGTTSLSINGVDFSLLEIFKVADSFYSRARNDEKIGWIYSSVKNWDEQVAWFTHLWWVRLGGRPYLDGKKKPIESKLIDLIDSKVMEHWLVLFKSIQNTYLSNKQAELWFEMVKKRVGTLLLKKEIGCMQHTVSEAGFLHYR